MLILMMSLALSAASAEPATTATPPAPAEVKPKKPKKICRANGATGTRMKSSTCKTQAEWDAEAGVAQDVGSNSSTVRN